MLIGGGIRRATCARGRRALVLLATIATVLGCASQAGATSLAAGDVVVYRVGNGTEALTSSATSAYLNEFESNGNLAATVSFPTSASGSNKPLVASGSAGSDGLMTLSGNSGCDVVVGYAAPVGTAKISNSSNKPSEGGFARAVGVVNGNGEVNTQTALTDFANENNARGATSSDCNKLWVGGAGKGTSGGVHFASLGASTSTVLNSTDTDVRQVEVAKNQLYTSADPTKAGSLTVATVGTGLPTTTGQTITNLLFATPAPEEPFAYSLLTLGSGSTPDTLYVADNKLGGVSKYGLEGGKWVRKGTVEIPFVTGVTANDVNGFVTIYAASAGENSREGTLYKIADESGLNGTLSGIPVEIAKAPANEAYRGVAFAPGTAIGSGGTPHPRPASTPRRMRCPRRSATPPTSPCRSSSKTKPTRRAH
jgi:hypothetical protein